MKIIFTRTAEKHMKKIQQKKALKKKVYELLDIIETDPFKTPPFYEKLIGDLEGAYSRRINIQHRLVYEVDEEQQQVKILSLWSHYEY